jgi:beta-phosphoglucomutase-like phosphatase (HAD superfamily)
MGLAESEEVHRQAFKETFAGAGIDWHWSVADYTDLLKTTGGKERIQRHRKAMGFGPSDAQIAALHLQKTARYGEILAQGALPLRAGVADLIAHARAIGLRLAVATTTSRPNFDAADWTVANLPRDYLPDDLRTLLQIT